MGSLKEELTMKESLELLKADESNIILTKRNETWVSNRWRPAMAWLYFCTCAFDFIIAPIASSIIYAQYGQTIIQWNPITLQGAGLYHLAMGAIIGITSWSRGQERICELQTMTHINTHSPITVSSQERTRVNSSLRQEDSIDADHIPRRHDPESRNIS
jgi:hypothetical protein